MAYRVLHVLDHSWPVLDGYSLRSRNIVKAQSLLGMQPFVLTGPLHQLEDASVSDTRFDDIPYRRTPFERTISGQMISRQWPVLREVAIVLLLRRRIQSLLDQERFDVVHAHSPALCGLAGWWAARARGIPFVYEIRAFWEDAAVNRRKTKQASFRYRLSRSLETLVTSHSDAVVGIAQPLLEDLYARGIRPERLFHIPNGVDADCFIPRPRDSELARRLGLNNEPVMGFIGTLFPWEGITWLVRAAAELRRRGTQFKLLIIGDGEDAEVARAEIRTVRGEDFIFMPGPVPHDQVQRYYSVMDIVVYPRRRIRLTELVTPLKPLEAMALGKPILASDVGGIRELVKSGKTSVLFEPDDIEGFCQNASQLLQDESWRRTLGDRARRMILEERDWKVLCRRYEKVYESAVQSHQDRLPSRR